jgi:hypothetical protein
LNEDSTLRGFPCSLVAKSFISEPATCRRAPSSALDEFSREVARDREALSPTVGATLEVQLRRFYLHLDNGNKGAAALAAKRAASPWRSLVLETWRADVTNFDGNPIDITRARSRRRKGSPTRVYLR